MHVFVAFQPAVIPGLVGIQVIENDMNLAVGVSSNDFVHEIQELASPPPLVVRRLHQTGGYFQRRKQRCGAMPLIAMAVAVDCFAVRQTQVPCARSSA